MVVLAVAGCRGNGGIGSPFDSGVRVGSPGVVVTPGDTLDGDPVGPDLPEQPVIPSSLEGFDAYQNAAGIDPRDSWKQTHAIQAYFDLVRNLHHPVFSLLTGTLLGSRDGIHYTQQTSGPADTIDINFLWHTQDVPDHVRGTMERAGKAWSYRLKDVFGSHQLTDSVVTRLGRDENRRYIPYHNDGLLVGAELHSYTSTDFRTHQSDGDDFMARSGYLLLSADDLSRRGDLHGGYLAAQQIGHLLGHQTSEPRLRPENILRNVDYERGVWIGPAVTKANGGVQVSFEQYRDGSFDFNHLAACRMVMSNCGYDRVIPHELDFAFLKDLGYTVADEYPTDPETYSYKAWTDYSTWSVTVGRALVFDPLGIDDFIGVKVEVTGNPSAAGIASAHSGTVTWNGSLLAADLTNFKPVFGDAEITLSTDTMKGTAAFTGLETVRQSDRGLSELTGWRNERLDYPVTATNDGFQDEDGRVTGTFYGPSHEEAAGTLHDEAEKITGAFGGKMASTDLEQPDNPPEQPAVPDPPEQPVVTDPPEQPAVPNPPEQPAVPASLAGYDVSENTASIDPRDSWKQTQPIQSYFDLFRYPRHPDPSSLKGALLGSRNGIYYTQQTSGPADTIDINFLWHTEDVPDHVRGIVERAGKAWSYRLKDVLGSHQLKDTVVTRLGRDESGRRNIPYHNNGLLVKSEYGTYSSGVFRSHQSDGDDFMTRSGSLWFSADDASRHGDVHAGYMAAQQIGHSLGHIASEPRLLPENILRYVDYERGLWTGPALTKANGGVPVSFEKFRDGAFNFNHLAACRMVMSNCGYDRVIPDKLDFAFLKDLGYTVADDYPTDPETYSYKAWAEHATWSVTTGRALVFDPLGIDDFIGVQVEVTGNPSGTSFAGSRSGTVTWNGSLLATDLTTFHPVFGNANITLSTDTMKGTAAFTGLETVRQSDRGISELTGWRNERLDYPVSVTSDGFQDAAGRVMGAFYGSSHEEAAGTLHDGVEKITGAFGGKVDSAGVELSEIYVNTAGADPRDTWRPVQPIRSYFGLSQNGPHQDPARVSGAVLGSGNGITYSQQMSGPTDTIDIDFTGYFPDMPDFVQGIIERAGKSWSYRMKDVFGSHQLKDTVVTRLGRDENGWAIPYHNDGILVDAETDLENPAWDYKWGYSRGGIREHQSDGDDFMMRSAWMELSAKDIECCGDIWAGYLAAHEVGHAIGHTATANGLPEHIRRYVDDERGVWTGPAVTKANGGAQVPYQRLNKYGRPSPDGKLDYGHLGACPMIMSYCGENRMIPHDLDFAYMKDIGYTILDEYPDEPEVYSYGAWAEYSSWSVTVKRALFFGPSRIDDYVAVEAGVAGSRSEATFSDTHIGTVAWNGSLLAADLATFAPVFGGAEITLSADTLDGTVAFTELKTVQKSNTGHAELSGWRVGRLDYSVSVTSNGFRDVDGRVKGALFGPSHEEAAGTLHDEVVRIMGAFGGKR